MQLPCLPSCNYGSGSVSWTVNVSYTADFYESYLGKYSVLEATKQIFEQRNDSSIHPYKKLKNDDYHHGQLIWPVSRIDAQHIMLGFLMEGHIYVCTSKSGSALSAEKSVIVFPDPGGPQRTMGLCSASQVQRRDSWRTVSRVGTTMSGEPTL